GVPDASCTVVSRTPWSGSRAAVRSPARAGSTSTVTMPANLPASSASWLRPQLPPCSSLTSARALTRPARSSPTTVMTRVVMGSTLATVSVGEVPGAGEVHGYTRRLRRGHDLLVADRPTRGDDGAHAGVQQHLQAVGEGEERVRG